MTGGGGHRFRRLSAALLLAVAVTTAAAGGEPLRILHTSGGSRVKTLDPAQADDLSSRNLTGAIYDTLLQYDYLARPYRLIPSMLAEMPTGNATHDRYRFRLRDDLRFADDPVFAGLPESARRITSDDVLYSILRIADARNHSPVYWLFRGWMRFTKRLRRRRAAIFPSTTPESKDSAASTIFTSNFTSPGRTRVFSTCSRCRMRRWSAAGRSNGTAKRSPAIRWVPAPSG